MQKEFESTYHAVEENYWWFRGRREKILRIIQKQGVSKGSEILEIGCSGGRLIELLNKEGFRNVTGIDTSSEAISHCRIRGLHNVTVMDGRKTEYDDGTFDLIIASDVLEHINNDDETLREWHRILKFGGKVIVFVPAFNFLWSSHDVLNCHYRRYTKSILIKKITEAGLKIVVDGYWNFILFIPVVITRMLERLFKVRKQPDRIFSINQSLNGMLGSLLKFENRLSDRIRFPVGVSLFTVVKK